MNKICAIILLTTIFHAICYADESYDTKYDNVDLDQILQNERLLKNYVNCLLDQGACTPDAKELKESLPDAISNECSKCSEKQKIGADKVTHFLIDNKPQEWEKLAAIYDPSGEYRDAYLKNKEQESHTEIPAKET